MPVVHTTDEAWRLTFEDLPASMDGETRAQNRADVQAAMPFDLAQGPLVRCLLVKLSESEHLLSITIHHIVSGAWSIGLFIKELSALYAVGGDASRAALPVAGSRRWQGPRRARGASRFDLVYWNDVVA